VHGIAAVAAARREGAAYLVGGTVHASVGKAGALGVGGLRGLCEAAGSLPVYAIGGIDAARAAQARSAGAHGVAVVSALLEADDPEAAARALWQAVH
jgi:thiamine-phosphate pyrophosphorylase